VWFQQVLKGINGIDETTAREILTRSGIGSNWWRTVGTISPSEQQDMLTPRNLDWHLNRYDDIDPMTGDRFSVNTPYISTTAGTVDPDPAHRRNVIRDAFFTAAWFATDGFRSDGYVFHGYVYTLGKPSVRLAEFAEEVRDLHAYTSYLPYRLEGELVAKISIPATRLEKAEKYTGRTLRRQLQSGGAQCPMQFC
jgi:hypothetical protein